MYDDTRTYELKDKTKEDLQLEFEFVLDMDLNFSSDTEFLDEDKIKITFYDAKIDKRLQTDNVITISQEQNKFNIHIRGKLSEAQIFVLWSKLEKSFGASDKLDEPEQTAKVDDIEEEKLVFYDREQGTRVIETIDDEKEEDIEITEKPEEDVLSQKEIIDYLYINNKKKGFNVDKVEIVNFVENFKKKLNKLPTKTETEAIGFGYIQMLNNEMGRPITEKDIEEMEAKEDKESELEKVRVERERVEKERVESEKIESVNIIVPQTSESATPEENLSSWANLKSVEKQEFKKKTYDRESLRIKLKPTPIPGTTLEEEKEKPKELRESLRVKLKPTPIPGISDEEFQKITKAETITEPEPIEEPSIEPSPQEEVKIIGKEKSTGLIIIQKTAGRRKCPNCGNSSPKKIHESTDKTFVISHYPLLYGKKQHCGECGCVWRET